MGKSFILPLLSSFPLSYVPLSVPQGTHITPHGTPQHPSAADTPDPPHAGLRITNRHIHSAPKARQRSSSFHRAPTSSSFRLAQVQTTQQQISGWPNLQGMRSQSCVLSGRTYKICLWKGWEGRRQHKVPTKWGASPEPPAQLLEEI